MAKVKALTSFAGIISMSADEIGNIEDEAILEDLVSAGYVLLLDEAKPEKSPAKEKKK